MNKASYHDISVAWPGQPRALIFNLPFALQLLCTRVGGWEVYSNYRGDDRRHAGEYDSASPLRVWFKDTLICGHDFERVQWLTDDHGRVEMGKDIRADFRRWWGGEDQECSCWLVRVGYGPIVCAVVDDFGDLVWQ